MTFDALLANLHHASTNWYCACSHPRSFRLCKGSEFGSRRPDVKVSVRWLTHADPTLWLEGAKRQAAVKSWNSFSACFYGRVSSTQQKKFFRPKIFLVWAIQFRHTVYEIYTTPLFIKNRMILEYKVTLLVLKLLNESYIFRVVFVINFSWWKVYILLFLKTEFITPDVLVSVTKLEPKYSRVFKYSKIMRKKLQTKVFKDNAEKTAETFANKPENDYFMATCWIIQSYSLFALREKHSE